mmetsp:Transcript_14221/g.21689  ORF Transcript_14221/g.21689 Transcript_14221/m.21689 type:complete len:250 (-) Transcript_14221:27-776(-)|eukprot:CAMPEP_0178920362 /NCGR_PEP_ID=MMETSP0786-20121207/14962_1 /TAXON_ID=186022 /ORGANISM="Thalassionema frauenfeldii, Strain CCMP 1798" /LENGTH=249 /DNA_ID=CAMNT_0020594419 /DNA_START=76 /DNA_END=825 /DNA_ORIENTATION=-
MCDHVSLTPIVSDVDIQSMSRSKKRGRIFVTGGKTAGESSDKKHRIVSLSTNLCSQRVTKQEESSTINEAWLDIANPTALLKSFNLAGAQNHENKQRRKPTEMDVAAYNKNVVTAVRTSDLEALKAMHAAGQSLDACNPFGESLLHMACRRGDPRIVKYLVEDAKVKIDVTDDYGRTMLHDAAWTSTPNFEVMEILLKAIEPGMLLAKDVRGHTPFDYARKEHWSAWVSFFMEHKDELMGHNQDAKVVS